MTHHTLDRSDPYMVNLDHAFFYNYSLDKHNIRPALLLPYLLEVAHIHSLNHQNYIREDINKLFVEGVQKAEKIKNCPLPGF